MKKRVFQILDEMNLLDAENDTRMVAVSYTMISADKVKQGTKVSMGASDQVLIDILNGKVVPILVVVDIEEFNKSNIELPETGNQQQV